MGGCRLHQLVTGLRRGRKSVGLKAQVSKAMERAAEHGRINSESLWASDPICNTPVCCSKSMHIYELRDATPSEIWMLFHL